ncbi:RNA polymerase II-associated protein 3-like [Amazona ochrocephala]
MWESSGDSQAPEPRRSLARGRSSGIPRLPGATVVHPKTCPATVTKGRVPLAVSAAQNHCSLMAHDLNVTFEVCTDNRSPSTIVPTAINLPELSDGRTGSATKQSRRAPSCLSECCPGWELDGLPGTSAEFYRDWRRCLKTRKLKYQVLLELGGEALGRIFQADLGYGLLGEFLVVLAENVCHEDRDAILQILQSLSGTKRFGLNLDLLSEPEKESSRDLFRKLWSMSREYCTAGHPSSTAGCKAEGGAQLVDASLQKETEEERRVLELMRCYQIN